MNGPCRTERPYVAISVSAVVHVLLVGALIWRAGPSMPAAAKVAAEISIPASVSEEVAAATSSMETVTAAVSPALAQDSSAATERVSEVAAETVEDIKPEITETHALSIADELPPLIETKAAEAAAVPASAPPPKPRRSTRTAIAPNPAPPSNKPDADAHDTPAHDAASVASPAPAASNSGETAREAPTGPPPDYLARLRSWLERHKKYPRLAQMKRQEGIALLRFTMTRDGRVVAHRVERSSGYVALDREVEEMIERASPLPAMPADMTQDRLEVVVPVAFALR